MRTYPNYVQICFVIWKFTVNYPRQKSTIVDEIAPAEWLSLNQLLYELKKIDARCVSVYYPYGKGKQTISLLQDTKRDEPLEKIELQIENKIRELKVNPHSAGKSTKTLCVFGWIKDSKIHTKAIGTSKRLPYVYMVSKKPYTKPFRDILKTNYDVILVRLDQKSAKIQKFSGNKVISEASLSLDLQGRHRKGGQSQGRFLRARQTKIHVFFKKVAAKLKSMDSGSELILLGGPGQAKTEFVDLLDSKLAKKCRLVKDLSFATGIHDVYKKIISQLYSHRRKKVTSIVSQYENLVKKGLTAKKNDAIYRALQRGAVDTLIVSAEYHTDIQFAKILKMLELAKVTSARIEFVTAPKIISKLKIHDSVLAILRYPIK